MGPSTTWDQWPRPVTRAVVGTQECTQIDGNGLSGPFWGVCVHCWAVAPLRTGAGTQECTQIAENGLSAPFWGVCVHCWTVGLGCGWPWDRNSVHKWEDRASPHRIGAFVYTVGLWSSCGQARGRRSVHRLAKMAPRSRFRAFVYTVVLWAWVVSGLGIAIVYTNGRIGPLGAVLGRLCTLLRHELCDASRVGWHERPNRHGVPAAPPLGGHLSLGREGRLYASGAIARLASSPRRQPTQTPEEPIHGQAFRRSYCHSPRAQ